MTNTSGEALDYTFCASLRNPFEQKTLNEYWEQDGACGIYLKQEEFAPDSTKYGDMTIATDAREGVAYQEFWYRGGWNDAVERFWRNFTEEETLQNRHYDTPGAFDTASLSVKLHAEPGETVHAHFILSWSFPNNYNYWSPCTKKTEDGAETDVTWKNYYATLFENSVASALYSLQNWNTLWQGTLRYHDELFSSTLPEEVIEAISATVSVLKSPTVLRLENGEFYGWEGVNEFVGSCEGTCTHVWNYAYALCFLFPKLERSIRETDFTYNQAPDGRMGFRMLLPLGRGVNTHRACVDGQMGGVIKAYREWKLSGDDEWLKQWWPKIKKSLEYAWSDSNYDKWDRDHDGVLEGRQHHTLDMELYGPSSWLEGFYLAALKCAAEMAERMGEPETAAEYRELFRKGQKWTEENLFNGQWYCQKLDLADRDYLTRFDPDAMGYWNEESKEIKYQIGEGCLLDQCLAQWHANLVGVGEIFEKEHLHTALRSMYRYNFLPDMRSHYNTFRLFAVNDESGAVICSFPEGAKTPAIPVPYAQETLHGVEYAFAGLLISEGFVEEGIKVVQAVRDRYRGFNRNPFNELECGSNYARSMASFALLPIFSGFRFDLPDGVLGFSPILEGEFRALWSVEGAWGNYQKKAASTELQLAAGSLCLRELDLPYLQEVTSVTADGKPVEFRFDSGRVIFPEPVTVRESIVIQ